MASEEIICDAGGGPACRVIYARFGQGPGTPECAPSGPSRGTSHGTPGGTRPGSYPGGARLRPVRSAHATSARGLAA